MGQRVRPLFMFVAWVCGSTILSLVADSAPVRAQGAPAAAQASATAEAAFGARLRAARDDAERGYLIFAEADRRDSGYGALEVSLDMILTSAAGRSTQRELRIRQLEMPTDGDRVLVIFDHPGNIRGTALLSHAHADIADEQWLFLPALKRVKKITTSNKTGAFLGSEFSYEDLTPALLEKYRYAFVQGQPGADTACDCYVVDRFPSDEFSAYSRQRVWLQRARFTIQHIDFYNRRDEVFKRLDVSEYAQHAGRYWKAGRMEMRNLQSRRSTVLVWSNYDFDVALQPERDFSVASLRRAR